MTFGTGKSKVSENFFEIFRKKVRSDLDIEINPYYILSSARNWELPKSAEVFKGLKIISEKSLDERAKLS